MTCPLPHQFSAGEEECVLCGARRLCVMRPEGGRGFHVMGHAGKCQNCGQQLYSRKDTTAPLVGQVIANAFQRVIGPEVENHVDDALRYSFPPRSPPVSPNSPPTLPTPTNEQNATTPPKRRAGKGSYVKDGSMDVRSMGESRFVLQEGQFAEVLGHTCYFLEHLPEARGVQPEARRLAEELRRKFSETLNAAKDLKANR